MPLSNVIHSLSLSVPEFVSLRRSYQYRAQWIRKRLESRVRRLKAVAAMTAPKHLRHVAHFPSLKVEFVVELVGTVQSGD